MKVKATKKFQELGIENNYQFLKTEQYFALRNGKTIELENIPQHLIDGKYIEIKKSKRSK